MYLDNPEYTCYPEEKEILLQAGLVLKVVSYEYDEKDNLWIIHLKTSEKIVKRHERK